MYNYYTYTAAFQCPVLLDIPSGEVEFSSRTPGSTATYTCNFGFVLQGDEQRVCMENETWSGEPPTCLRKFRFHSCYLIPDVPFLFVYYCKYYYYYPQKQHVLICPTLPMALLTFKATLQEVQQSTCAIQAYPSLEAHVEFAT